jgi:uncharacterized phage protein (TIGR01671 family)
MQDRFKFRAWDSIQKFYEWEIENCYDGLICYSFGDFLENSQYIVEQCTGLKDKNGKLIYDNDLIKIGNEIYRVAVDDFGCRTVILNNNPFTEVIEWSDIVKIYYFYNRENELEVIGNIHENADLFKTENE